MAQPRWRAAASAFWKPVGGGDGLRREGGEAGRDHALDHLRRLEGQDRLAFRRRVRGLAHAEVGARADRMRAFEIVDIHDLDAVEDREMHALVDGLAQRIEIGPRLVRHLHAPAHQRAEPEQPDAKPVSPAVAVLLQHAFRHQRHGEPVRGALGDAEALRQRADADLDLVLGEGLEEPHGGRDRGQPLALARLDLAGRSFRHGAALWCRRRWNSAASRARQSCSAVRTVVPN